MVVIFQILANGIVSLSGRGSTCTKIVSQNFEKKRSKSNEKICTEKANRWVRSNSQEYDEVPNDSRTLTRCQSGGTSEAAEAAANLAMLAGSTVNEFDDHGGFVGFEPPRVPNEMTAL